jgi:hypothetical protein
MVELMPEVGRLGGYIPPTPMAAIVILVNMANMKD